MTNKKKMTIVGFGRMGKKALVLFNDGFNIDIISSRNIQSDLKGSHARQSKNIKRSLASANYIFLAVPVWVIRKWISRINQGTKEDCVIIDCCTARIAAVKELSSIRRRMFSLPELGPGNIPIIGKADSAIARYLLTKGTQLSVTTDKKYDKDNIAGLAHFIGMGLDLYLGKNLLSYAKKSRAVAFITGLIQHLKSNSNSTYKETQLLNPFMSAARKNVINALKKFDKELNSGKFKFKAYSRDKWRK